MNKIFTDLLKAFTSKILVLKLFKTSSILGILPLLFLGFIPFIVHAQTPQPYTTFEGVTVDLYKWEGQKVMLLSKSNNLNAETMGKWANAMDAAYNFYQICTGREPEFNANRTYINNRTTLAEVDKTCGAGCGYLGTTGIELQSTFFQNMYAGILNNNQYDQVPFYEFGRNFWFYSPQLEYKANDPIVTGYAVFMRFMAIDYAAVQGAPFNGISYVDFRSQVRNLINIYVTDPSLTWNNTLGQGQGVPGQPWGATDLFASFCLYLYENYGGQNWVRNVWKFAGQRPAAVTTQDAVDNFIIAASQAANRNLSSLFQCWKWPVSVNAVNALENIFPVLNDNLKDLTLSTWYQDSDGDGFGNPSVSIQACAAPAGYVSTAGDCVDNNNAVNPGATEVKDGIDNNCNGQIDEGFSSNQPVPIKVWDKSFGGSLNDGVRVIQQTSDGGYILGGFSNSGISGDKTEASKGDVDYWIVKINATGLKEWDKTFGGSGRDDLASLQQTTDGGYILGGSSSSGISGDKTEASTGLIDYWVLKISATGVKEWDKTFGGSGDDALRSLQQTKDKGYILGGFSNSGISGDKTEASKGMIDYWVVKISATGVKEWDKTFGGNDSEEFSALQQTTDGGYILGGSSSSGISGDKTEASKGLNDYWVVKISATGVKEWDKTFGGTSSDGGLRSLRQTTGGGYILGGFSSSGISGDKTEASRGNIDYWVVKISATGAKEWDKTFGGNSIDEPFTLHQTTDGGYIIGGQSYSGISGDKTEANKGGADYWVVKISAAGGKVWDKSFGGNANDILFSIQQTSDEGYILGGNSFSGISGDKTEAGKGLNDCWIVKICASPQTFYRDADGDGFGDPSQSALDCAALTGYVTNNTDCDDASAAKYPGATEICDGIDNDCDGIIDNGVLSTYYPDADADGFGAANGSVQACTAPAGFVSNNTDCDDTRATVYPRALELCDGLDNNCDGIIDEGCPPAILPIVYIDNASVTEGNSGTGNIVFTMRLSNPWPSPVTVQYQTVNGTATAPSDFTSGSGIVTFPPNATSQSVSIAIVADQFFEFDEKFEVSLSSPVNATLGNNSAVGTIINDDRRPVIRIENLTVNENIGVANVAVSLSVASNIPVSVLYNTTDGSAKAPDDYTSTAGLLTFQPGEMMKFIPVVIKTDILNEKTESFEVRLENQVNATIEANLGGRLKATVRIINVSLTPLNKTTLTNASGTTDQLNALQVKVLPNPSQHQFQINITGNGKGTLHLRVTDMQGRLLEERKTEGMTQQIKLGENWINGTYILQVTQGDERKTIQLVKLK